MIATFTDFGTADPYLGQVRAVMHQQAPGVPVVDIFAELPAFHAQAAAYLVPAYSQYLPSGTICLCVVDPGVGGARAALAVDADGRWYVGPDNGLLSQVIAQAARSRVYEITWRPDRLSDSFHGRDLFAPVCAMLARGEPVPGRELVQAGGWCQPEWPADLHEVVYVDHYGNAITGLRAGRLAATAGIEIGGVHCKRGRTFCEAPPQTAFWYANANGLVEIAVSRGGAAPALELTVGQSFRIR
jgi:S-adenosylmethionine hydrolase